jgi:hypothetical protein
MPITGAGNIIVSVQETLATPENRSGAIIDAIRVQYPFANGTGNFQNDLVWQDRMTIGAGVTAVIDLSPLALDLGAGFIPQTNSFGTPITFVEVTMIVITGRSTGPGTRAVSFGPNSAGTPYLWLFLDASDLVSIRPQGAYLQWSDEAIDAPIVAGVNDQLRLINTDGVNAVNLDIMIIGRSA